MNGLLTVGAVRTVRRPKLPVLFMPGYTEDVLPEDASPDIQLTLPRKPFTGDELMDKIHHDAADDRDARDARCLATFT